MRSGGEGGKDVDNVEIEFARVGLAADRHTAIEAEAPGESFFEADDSRGAAEEFEEGGLCACCAAKAAALDSGFDAEEVAGGGFEVGEPEGGAFSDGRELRGLEVSKTEGWEVGEAFAEGGEFVDDGEQTAEKQADRVSQEQQVGVVDDVHAGRAEVDNSAGGGSGLGEGVDVCHDVVPRLALVAAGGGEVDLVDDAFHGGDLFR